MLRLPRKKPKVFFGYDVRRDKSGARRVMERWRFKAGQVLDMRDCYSMGPFRIPAQRMVQRRIDAFIDQSVATVILIGKQTKTSEHIKFAIRRTHQLEKGMLGIYIDSPSREGSKSERIDQNPFILKEQIT